MAAIYPVAGAYATNPSYSGTFIPSIWSAKLAQKFYANTLLSDISNTDWQGDISGMGDKVIINVPPTISVTDYVVGTDLTYEVPTPSTTELQINKGKAFAFRINDVLSYQAKPNLLDTFSQDAAEQMKIAIESNVFYGTVFDAAAANQGATAGSTGIDMGTAGTPVTINATAGDAANVLTKILQLASLLDEQHVPESDRWLLIDPATRVLLMQSNLAQAQFMGDDKSPVRNGKIGVIDRFSTYVTTLMPTAAAAGVVWTSGDGTQATTAAAANAGLRRMIVAGHKSAITFASQVTKMETVRNPNDFGDYIRSLNVFGYKVIKPEALAVCVVK